MRIGIISRFNPHVDKKAHSGILYKINQSIENAGIETVWIHNPVPTLYKVLQFACRAYHYLFGKCIYLDRTFIGTKLLASTIDSNKLYECDFVIVVIILWLYIISMCLLLVELANLSYIIAMPLLNLQTIIICIICLDGT